jgi:hypothetical protein
MLVFERLRQLSGDSRDDVLYWRGVLLLLIVAGCWWGAQLTRGAPFVYHPDEAPTLARALIMLETGDPNPHWFHYSSLYMYLQASLAWLVHLFGGVPVGPGAQLRFEGARFEALPFYVAGRALTLSFALGTTFLVTAITRRIAGTWLALLGGALFVTSGLVLRSAIYVTVDMPLTFFVTLSAYLMMRVVGARAQGLASPPLWPIVVSASLAAGAKYNGALVLVVFAGVFLTQRGVSLKSARELAKYALLSIAVFALTTPYAVLDWSTFLDREQGVVAEILHYTSGHLGADRGSSLLKMIDTFRFAVSPLLLLTPLSVPVLDVKNNASKERAEALVLLAVLVVLGLPVAEAKVYFERNCLPLVPPAIALTCLVLRRAAAAAVALAPRLLDNAKWRRVALIAAAICATAVPLQAAYEMQKLYALTIRKRDTRTAAYIWATRHLPVGSRVLREAFTPQLDLSRRFVVDTRFSLAELSPEEIEQNYDYVVTSSSVWLAYPDLRKTSYEYFFSKKPVFEIPSFGDAPAIRIDKVAVPAVERRTVFRLSEAGGFNDVYAIQDVRISDGAPPGVGPLVLDSTGRDPSILLPELPPLEKGRFLLRVSLTSPAETMLQVFYSVPSAPNFNEENSCKRRIMRGKNEVEIRFGPAQIRGRLRLDPGERRGRYLLHAITLHELAS